MDEIFSQLFTLLGLGFVLGLQHALDADHVVTVSTLVSKTKSLKKSSLLGIFWGLGHTTTLFIIGIILLVFKWSIPNQLVLSFEFLVGVLLVLLGADVLRKLRIEEVHIHEHEHEDGIVHSHLHSHRNVPFHEHKHRSFLVGLIHGLAGSAALSLLVLSTTDTLLDGLLFILFFGIGSILGMFATSTLLALPFKFIGNFKVFNNALKASVGVTSITLGVFVMYKIGYLFMGFTEI